MVGAGIIRRNLPAANEVIVTLNDPSVPALAAEIGNTRSAAAVRLWRDRIEGAVVAIGNAPTALFHLLELLDQGWPRPAVILGFPVGFVGAAESKAELANDSRGAEFIALRGRKGGSAMASAAVNALAAGSAGGGRMTAPWLHIVGIGEDGMEGLTPATRAVVEAAEVVIGGDRHHRLSDHVKAERVAWPSPFDTMIDAIESYRGRRLVILATGDPLWYSVGARIGRVDRPRRDRLSSASLCVPARLGPDGLVDGGP